MRLKTYSPPKSILQVMELQVAAERQKRANILESEGKRQSQINVAEGEKAQVVLNSEASMTDQINRAKGKSDAVSLKIAEQYVHAFSKLGKESNTIGLYYELDHKEKYAEYKAKCEET